MRKAYKLRPEYEGALVGGTVTTGPDAETLDIMQSLEEGGGEISTEDSQLQSVLENYYGAQGLLFDAFVVNEDGSRDAAPLVDQNVPPHLAAAAANAPMASPDNPPNPSPPMPDLNNPQGGSVSDYENFTVEELREVVKDREVTIPTRANKSELIAALEADDAKGDTL